MKESVNRTLFFISLLLSRTIVTENPIDVHPYSTLLNFFPALSTILANMRSHGFFAQITYSFSCLITACARYTCHFDSFEAPNRAKRLLIKTCARSLVALRQPSWDLYGDSSQYKFSLIIGSVAFLSAMLQIKVREFLISIIVITRHTRSGVSQSVHIPVMHTRAFAHKESQNSLELLFLYSCATPVALF